MTPQSFLQGRDTGQNFSDLSALIATALLASVLLVSLQHAWQQAPRTPSVNPQDIELSVQAAPPSVPQVQPPVPPRPAAMHHPHPAPLLAEPATIAPVEEAPIPEGAAVIASTAPSPPPATQSHADIEAQYAAALREDIDRRTHPPDSAQYRLHHPSGEVRVRFIVTRAGEPEAATVIASSGSSLLDEAAVKIVAQGRYLPMPEKAFAGESTHTFVVTIEFRSANRVAAR